MTLKLRALGLLLTWCTLSACSSPARCPKTPAPAPTPNPPPALACPLPPLPAPLALTPEVISDDRVALRAQDVRDLVAYLASVRAWIRNAQVCLATDEVKP